MGMEFLPDRPIYQQLVEHIIGEVIRGAIAPGEKLPSVREYALEVGVNANTMQRVYKELEQLGVTETKRGQGSFASQDKRKLQEIRENLKSQLVESFMKKAESYGFTAEEMARFLEGRGE
ncbi:GntR family transcriptional regulator [Aciduricibacillus chroicocephali]|uniref:GntR family transcriptional regulator n=1 Tax=Aciduricibacillus chroicocephali TaxID=3054939 RepID=A0ABY9KX75_9BACI|nr:GntR family transcriptional regulator [Bacillaceae bacterium 44XB]